MEQIDNINKELEQKVLERPKQVDFATGEDVIEGGKVNQVQVSRPKKPRTEAQKEAFEKARKKRAENLKKKKEEEEGVSEAVVEDSEVVENQTRSLPKKRGRPKGVKNKKVMKREPEPTPDNPNYPKPVEHPIYEAKDSGHRYQGQQYLQPYPPMAYQPPMYQHPPAPAPQPVNNYYYYGSQPSAPDPQVHPPQTEEDYEIVVDSSDEDQGDYLDATEYLTPPPDPRLKFRFA